MTLWSIRRGYFASFPSTFCFTCSYDEDEPFKNIKDSPYLIYTGMRIPVKFSKQKYNNYFLFP